jgi:hypothetical protein
MWILNCQFSIVNYKKAKIERLDNNPFKIQNSTFKIQHLNYNPEFPDLKW